MVSALIFPLLLWWLYRGAYPAVIILAACAGSALIIARHSANIRRLRAGTENRLGRPRAASVSRA
jgi:glycerol-3-phosphate acyltransferase PlsY